MAASIGSFTFDAMRDRLSPGAVIFSNSGSNTASGAYVPIPGTITTEKKLTTNSSVVSTSQSYRDAIGSFVSCDINGTTIPLVLIIDCRTSLVGSTPHKSLVAEWRLAASVDWNP